MFGRCEDGRSICLLIKGVQPSFEITPLTAWQEGQEIPQSVLDRLKLIKEKEDVVDITGPVMKLTDLGMRPIWQVTTRQPYVVPNLRKSLAKQSWGIYSGDIPFLNRLFLDSDLSMHIHANGEVIDTIDTPNNNQEQTVKVRAAGGAGRYSCLLYTSDAADE